MCMMEIWKPEWGYRKLQGGGGYGRDFGTFKAIWVFYVYFVLLSFLAFVDMPELGLCKYIEHEQRAES